MNSPQIFRERRALIAIAVGLPVVELGILHATGLRSAFAMAPQVSAPAPFGIFHDLRWVLVYHYSWLTFGLEAGAMLLFRAALAAVMVRAAWPSSIERPSLAAAFRRALVFTAVSSVLLLPWAGLLFGLAVTPISWLFFAAVPPVVLLGLLIHPGAVRSFFHGGPSVRSAMWTLSTFFAMTWAGMSVSLAGARFAYVLVAAAGLYNAWAWDGVVRSLTGRPPSPALRRALAPLGVAALMALVVGGSAIGFSAVHDSSRLRDAEQKGIARARTVAPSGIPVLVVRGFGSAWDGTPRRYFPAGAFAERRFSYRGMVGGEPRAYDAADTERSLAGLIAAMDAQVRAFAAQRRASVSIVAESEGALVAKAYIAVHPNAPVRQLVVLSPLIRPGRVYYPPAGSQDWGVATSYGLRGLARVIGSISTLQISPESPLLRDITDDPARLQRVLDCPVPGIPEHAIVPLADSVVAPYGIVTAVPIEIIPAFHGGLIGDSRVKKAVVAELTTGAVPTFGAWARANDVIRAASGAWQVPSLAPALFPHAQPVARCA